MMSATMIFMGFILPAMILFGGLVVSGGRSAGAIFVGAAFAVAYWNLEPVSPGVPGSGDVVSWIFYLTIPLAILGIFETAPRFPQWARGLALLLVWRVLARLLLGRLIPHSISATAAELWIDGTTIIALLWYLGMQTLAEDFPRITVPLILAIVSAGAAITAATAWHVQTSGTLAGALVALCAGAFVAALVRKDLVFRGGATALIILLLAVLTHAFFYTDDELTTGQLFRAGVLIASPLLALGGDLPAFRGFRPGWRLVVRLVPVVLAVGVISVWNVHDYLQAEHVQAGQEGY